MKLNYVILILFVDLMIDCQPDTTRNHPEKKELQLKNCPAHTDLWL